MIGNSSCSTPGLQPTLSDNRSGKTDEEPLVAHFQQDKALEDASLWGHLKTMMKFFFSKGQRVPVSPLPQVKVNVEALSQKSDEQLVMSWLGHSSMLINIDGSTILTDPLFERSVTMVGPTRFHDELVLDVEDVSHVDAVLISHNHYDHLNKYSIKKLIDKSSVFIVPLGVGKKLQQWGVPVEKVVELEWWQEYRLPSGVLVAATPSQHFSGRGLSDRNKTLWVSYAIVGRHHRVFFSGDSGYFDGFRKIGQKYGPFDMTFMECGAYDKKWPKVHMFPEQTVQAHQDLRGKVLQPIHWATLNLAFHAWYEPGERLVSESWSKGVTLSLPIAGEVIDYHDLKGADIWWQQAIQQSKITNDMKN